MRGLIGLGVGLALAACGGGETRVAEEAVRAQLVEPGSAAFSQVRAYEGGTVCGLVNARNRMGGFSGPRDFAYVPGEGVSLLLLSGPGDEVSAYPNLHPRHELHQRCLQAIRVAADAAAR